VANAAPTVIGPPLITRDSSVTSAAAISSFSSADSGGCADPEPGHPSGVGGQGASGSYLSRAMVSRSWCLIS
jgi:hypothetical protein